MIDHLAKRLLRRGVVALQRGLECIEIAQVPLLGCRQGGRLAMDPHQSLGELPVVLDAQFLGAVEEGACVGDPGSIGSMARLHQSAEKQNRQDGRSEEHTSELQSLMRISYAVFCLKKKKQTDTNNTTPTQHKAQTDSTYNTYNHKT